MLLLWQVHINCRLFILRVVANEAQSKWGQCAWVSLAEKERAFRLCTRKIISAGVNLPAAPVIVANQQRKVVPRDDVVITVGMLADAAMNIHAGILAMRSKLEGEVFQILRAQACDLSPFFDGLLVG